MCEVGQQQRQVMRLLYAGLLVIAFHYLQVWERCGGGVKGCREPGRANALRTGR